MPQVVALGSIGHDGADYVKDDVIEVTVDQAKELIEAGSARAVAYDETEIEAPVELPKSFTTDDGDYSTKLNTKGKVSGYLLDGVQIKKVEYTAAYEASLEAADDEDDSQE